MPPLHRYGLTLMIAALASAAVNADESTVNSAADAARKKWRREYAAFLQLPSPTQERLRQLDGHLREEDAETQGRLLKVMQRYCDWLERLPPEQRQQIEGATSTAEKVERIRAIREQQWIATLPKADRDRLAAAQPEERRQLIGAFRERERKMEEESQPVASPERLPRPLQEFNRWREEVTAKLSDEERQRLQEAQRKGRPAMILLLIQLSEQHQVPVPRRVYPQVSQDRLKSFWRDHVDPMVRKDFESRFKDPEQKEQAQQELVRIYWRQHPEELKRQLEEADRKRLRNRPAKTPGG